MCKNSSKSVLGKKGILMSLIVMCCLLVSEKVFSQNRWSRDLMYVTYIPDEKAVQMAFEFKEFVAGSKLIDSYLESCDFEFSTDSVNYTHLMSASIYDTRDTVGLNMHNKLTGAAIQFFGCYVPPCTTNWADNTNVRVLVNYDPNNQYWLTIRWFLHPTFHGNDKLFIRINGKWEVTGSNPDTIKNEVYKVNTSQGLPSVSEVDTDSNPNNSNLSDKLQFVHSAVKIAAEADAVVIKGAVMGENISVYTTSGIHIKSVVTDNDVVKINLPKDQIYIVNIGQARQKVAL